MRNWQAILLSQVTILAGSTRNHLSKYKYKYQCKYKCKYKHKFKYKESNTNTNSDEPGQSVLVISLAHPRFVPVGSWYQETVVQFDCVWGFFSVGMAHPRPFYTKTLQKLAYHSSYCFLRLLPCVYKWANLSQLSGPHIPDGEIITKLDNFAWLKDLHLRWM